MVRPRKAVGKNAATTSGSAVKDDQAKNWDSVMHPPPPSQTVARNRGLALGNLGQTRYH